MGSAMRLTLVIALLLFLVGLGYGRVYSLSDASGHNSIPTLPDARVQHSAPASAAVAVINSFGHWGEYEGTLDGRTTHGDAVHKAFQLVGIERKNDDRLALLLFRPEAGISAEVLVTAADSDNILRVRSGDWLLQGIQVIGIGDDKLQLAEIARSNSDNSTRKEPQRWQLSIYPEIEAEGQ